MAAARLLVAGEQRLLVGVEEQHAVARRRARSRSSSTALERLEVVAAAHVGDDRRALDLRALVHEQLDERADHLRRQVVDAEVARVLEDVHRRRLAGAREAGDDDEVLEPRARVQRRRRRRRRGSGVRVVAGGAADAGRGVAIAPTELQPLTAAGPRGHVGECVVGVGHRG